MTIFRPMHWTLCCLAAALAVAGCTSETTSGETTGSLSLNLELVSGVVINQVDWVIAGGDMEPMGGSIDTSAPGATASVEVFGLPPDDDYVVELEATTEDGDTTCKGSAEFDVEIGETTDVMVILNCKLPRTLGGVRVNGKFNICTELTKAVVSPLQTSVGNDISLSAQAFDEEGDTIHYIWSGDGGSIADPSAPSTTYTCQEVGDHMVTIMVTDNDVYCRMATWTIPVTCVEGDGGDLCEDVICEDDGNECTATACNAANGACETSNVEDGTNCDGGTCASGVCVEDNLCEGVTCDDTGNDCTVATCNQETGVCDTSNVANGTSCNGDAGMCVDGACIEDDLCEGVTCDDTGNDCTVAMCNQATGVCDTMNAPDGTECNGGAGACSAGVCIDNNLCVGVDCTSQNDCVQDGTCDPATGTCIAGDNQPLDTACTSNGGTVCDGNGNCVACNAASQCPDDGNECTAAACETNACVQNNVMEGQACDFGGSAGICEAGACVAAPECISPGDCNDGNPCTVGDCPDGMCVFSPASDGTACDVSAGVPGTCTAGDCVGLCENVDCSNDNQCRVDPTCDPADGQCKGGSDEPIDTPCDQGGGSVCDGQGTCVQCNSADQCPADANDCTAASCVDGACGQANVADGTSCDGGSGECQVGVCEPVGPPTFDLSQSVFVAYNTLLPFNPGVCDDPDLDNGGTQCVKVFPPDIRGTVELTETTTGNWDVHIEQTLNSTIPARLDAFNADVIINADSLTVLDATGTGSVPGTIILDEFTDAVGTQNTTVDTTFPGAGGTAQCLAVVQTGAGADCNLTGGCSDPLVPCSECLNFSNQQTCGNLVANECDPVDASGPLTNPLAVCNLAGLPITSCTQWPFNGLALEDSGCFYDLPTPDDNLARLLATIVTTDTSLQLDGGPNVAGGYYRANAYDPGSGPQWIALAGVQQ